MSNPILARLEQTLQEERERSLDISYHVRLSRLHLSILEETAQRLNIKQSELIRTCISNLPDLLK